MKQGTLIGALLVAAAWFVASAEPGLGADSAVVAAQVSVANACLSVSPQSLDFGTMAFPASSTSSPGGNALQQPKLTNCGVANENVYARGTDATSSTSTAKWTLIEASVWSSAGGKGFYNLGLLGSAKPPLWLTKTDALWGALAGGATDTHSAFIGMPQAGSGGAGETMTMQIVYTASL